MIPYYCCRCGAVDEAGAQKHRCKPSSVTPPPAQSVTDRRRKWEKDNVEKNRAQTAARVRKLRARKGAQ